MESDAGKDEEVEEGVRERIERKPVEAGTADFGTPDGLAEGFPRSGTKERVEGA
jgi:hypothetical protein